MSLECSRSIKKAKKDNLVFEIAILGLESYFLFIIFTNPYLMIDINEI